MAGMRRLVPAASRWLVSLGVRRQSRSYGAAVALELSDDEDYCDYYEDEKGRRLGIPAADSPGDDGVRGVHWVFIGNPSVEKSAYAGRLARIVGVPHISMGGLVRGELLSARSGSTLSKQIASALNEGKLLPDNIILGLLSKRLEQGYYQGETGFILDGFPRTRIQAEILGHIADVDLVVNFKCVHNCLMKKHLGSCGCVQCSTSVRSDCNINSSSDIQCSSTLQGMVPTDVAINKGALQEKLKVYIEESKPLEDYYRKRNKLLDFEVANGTRETWESLLEALHLEHIDTKSQQLTA